MPKTDAYGNAWDADDRRSKAYYDLYMKYKEAESGQGPYADKPATMNRWRKRLDRMEERTPELATESRQQADMTRMVRDTSGNALTDQERQDFMEQMGMLRTSGKALTDQEARDIAASNRPESGSLQAYIDTLNAGDPSTLAQGYEQNVQVPTATMAGQTPQARELGWKSLYQRMAREQMRRR